MSKFVKSGNGLPSLVWENPPISFISKARKIENVNGADLDNMELMKFNSSWTQANLLPSMLVILLFLRMSVLKSGSSG
jgi:hypothetical protein